MKKTLPGRQAATMFFSSSGPNDIALVVKHSNTQSDNNELSATAARNYWCKTKVLDCVSELKADSLARCRDKVNLYCISQSLCYSYSGLSGQINLMLILCLEIAIESHVRWATWVVWQPQKSISLCIYHWIPCYTTGIHKLLLSITWNVPHFTHHIKVTLKVLPLL